MASSSTSKFRLKAVQGAIFFVATSGLKMAVRQYRGDGLRNGIFLGNMQYRPIGHRRTPRSPDRRLYVCRLQWSPLLRRTQPTTELRPLAGQEGCKLDDSYTVSKNN